MKKIITLLLAVFMIFSLTACGSNEDSAVNEDGSIVIKIGASGPLSGDNMVYGIAVRNAAQLAIDEINASDSKIKFDFKMEDDECSDTQSPICYSTLYDWGMQVSLFTVTSGAGAAVAKSYDDDKIFALTPSGSNPALVYTDSKNYRGNFQMCFTDPNQGISSADYIAENFKDSKVGIIYKKGDVYSEGVYDKFISEAAIKGVNIVYKDGAFLEGDSDFTTQLTAAKSAGADFVFLPIYYQPASNILDQAKKMDYFPTFFGVDGMDGILDLDGFNKELANGVYLLTPFSATSTDAKTVKFVEAFKNKYNEVPNQFAADAYDCVYAILQALNNIGVNADYNFDNLYEDMIKQFTTMSFDGLTGTSMTWKENGEISKAPEAFVIQDGVYVK